MAFLNWILIYHFNIPRLYYHIDQIGFGCYWLSVGYFIKEHLSVFKRIILGENRHAILIGSFIAYVAMIYFWGSANITFYGAPNFLIWFIVTLFGLLVMIGVANIKFTQNPFLLYIGANTLSAFAVHGKIHKLVSAIVLRYVDTDTISEGVFLVIGIGETLIVAVLMTIPLYLINRYCPLILGKGFKLWHAASKSQS